MKKQEIKQKPEANSEKTKLQNYNLKIFDESLTFKILDNDPTIKKIPENNVIFNNFPLGKKR